MFKKMSDEFRQIGIGVIGTVPWGTHFCQFYQTKEDLLDTLVTYFKAGLENNEFCMWITSEPLSAEEAGRAMRRAMPDFDDRIGRGQIEILPHNKGLNTFVLGAQRGLEHLDVMCKLAEVS